MAKYIDGAVIWQNFTDLWDKTVSISIGVLSLESISKRYSIAVATLGYSLLSVSDSYKSHGYTGRYSISSVKNKRDA